MIHVLGTRVQKTEAAKIIKSVAARLVPGEEAQRYAGSIGEGGSRAEANEGFLRLGSCGACGGQSGLVFGEGGGWQQVCRSKVSVLLFASYRFRRKANAIEMPQKGVEGEFGKLWDEMK